MENWGRWREGEKLLQFTLDVTGQGLKGIEITKAECMPGVLKIS